MLANYLKTALRNLLKFRAYAAINLLGLAVGMTCCLFVMLAAREELRVDGFHEKGDRIFKLVEESRRKGGDAAFGWGVPGALGPAFREACPEVEQVVRTMPYGGRVEAHGKSLGANWSLVDPGVLDVFTYPLERGDPAAALSQPASAVITHDMAARYFGEADPIGEVLTIHNRKAPGDFVVTGVLAPFPAFSTFGFDFLIVDPRSEETRGYWEDWLPTGTWRPVETFVLLKEGADPALAEEKLAAVVASGLGADFAAVTHYHLQPLTRIFLYTRRDYGFGFDGIAQVTLQLAIAAFILIIACINSVNLATARSSVRAREVGMRKVAGASRRQLVGQFLGEALLLTFLSLPLAVGMSQMLLPFFNDIFGFRLSVGLETWLSLLPWLLGATVATGLAAGLYPAFVLSAHQPASTIKAVPSAGTWGVAFRKGLVVVQFAASVVLIVGTLVVNRQVRFLVSSDPGFDTDGVFLLPLFVENQERVPNPADRLSNDYASVREDFLKVPNVIGASAFRSAPIWDGSGNLRRLRIEGAGDAEWQVPVNEADEHFFDFFGLPMLSGRTFTPISATADWWSEYIINETAARRFGWKNAAGAIGKEIEWIGGGPGGTPAKGTVIGVVKDFHTVSLRSEIGPQIFCRRTSLFSWLGLKLGTGDRAETMRHLEKLWPRYSRDEFAARDMADDLVRFTYWNERQLVRMSGVASGIAIFVACLGLLGLAAFAARQRTREIAVRKVLGGTLRDLILLLSKDFVRLVAIANLVAWPLAWYALSEWLSSYPYRAGLGVSPFLLSGAGTTLIALLTVAHQAFRAFGANPVDALKAQ